MEKLKMQTPDLTDKNIEQIGAMFPNVITETRDENGAVKKAVDFDLLKQALSKSLVEDDAERYRLDWPGKKASLLKANTPITKTLRPCVEESSGKDGSAGKFDSENLYIEGDNFEVLKVLQESYLGKVKMIYIDPPYNTGNDFIYKDDFAKSKNEYEEELGTTDEDGGRLFRNTDSNGRYHSDWLSMMYERLLVARDLLKDDGVIFISIDDNEVHNLRKICDEVFGEENFLDTVVWKKTENIKMDSRFLSQNKDYVLLYRKNPSLTEFQKEQSDINRFTLEDDKGKYYLRKLDSKSSAYRPTLDYVIENNGIKYYPGGTAEQWRKRQAGNVGQFGPRWLWSRQKFEQGLKQGDVIFKDGKVYNKVRYDGVAKKPFTDMPQLPSGQTAQKELNELLEKRLFDYPKSPQLIKWLIKLVSDNNDFFILDFFSGSATTAHAVMQLNAKDGGNRKFIMVQLPELCDEKSEAFKAGYKTIPDIGKERIRRAGKKIVGELREKNQQLKMGEEPVDAGTLDIGFRVYKTDTTNMKDVFYHPSELTQDQMDMFISNIKEDRGPEDLLTQVILDLGLELNLPIETTHMLGNTVFMVQSNALVACFDDDIDFKIVDSIAELKPLKVVFKDASFKDDKDRINVEERFKRLSPDTKVTVI